MNPTPRASGLRRSRPTVRPSTSASAARAGRSVAARLWRDRRHVGAACRRTRPRPHRGRARPARHGPLVSPRGRLRQEDPSAGHRRRPRCAEDRPGRPCHARYRQHGRLCIRGAVPEPGTRFVIMDAPLPGVGPWDQIVRSRALWHFSFQGPDAERLVAGRERIYLDRFWNEFSAIPKASARPPASTTPGSMRSPARCMPASTSSRPSIRTRSTTRPSSPRASSPCRSWPWAATIVRADHGGRHARRGDRCHRARDPELGSLADGRAAGRDGRRDPRLPRSETPTVDPPVRAATSAAGPAGGARGRTPGPPRRDGACRPRWS